MKAVQTTYCTSGFLDEVIRRRKESRPHKIALRIMQNLSDIVVDMPLAELRQRIKTDPIYKQLVKRDNKSVRSVVDWKSQVNFYDVGDSLFLVDSAYLPNYSKLRGHYGCLAIAQDKDMKMLERLNDRRGYICIAPPNRKSHKLESGYQDSWEEAIRTCELKPINSLIICDNYLLSNIATHKENSLFALLKAIVPETLYVTFHLAIFSLKSSSFHREDAEALIEEIRNLFPRLKMKITIVSHNTRDTTHDRELISNYHRLTSGRGFSVFNDTNDEVFVTKGEIEPVYFNVLSADECYMTTKHYHYQLIEWLRPLYKRQGCNGTSSFVVGDCIHRLLD